MSLDFDDKINKLALECLTFPCLHSDVFHKPTLKHPYTFVCFLEEICLVVQFFDSIGRMSKLITRYLLKLMLSLIAVDRTLIKRIKAYRQLLLLILIHHCKQLLQPYHNPKFFHQIIYVRKKSQMHTAEYLALIVTFCEGFNLDTGNENPIVIDEQPFF